MSKEKEQLQAEEIYLENTCDYLISFNLIFTNPHMTQDQNFIYPHIEILFGHCYPK
jgi:hypothetical protein